MKKTILITGSTDGIGKLAALRLATEGHHILIHGRNAEKLERVKDEIISNSNNDKVYGFVADFSILEQVKSMAVQIKDQFHSIDVIVNNAGIFKTSSPIAHNGMDVRMVVNYLAPVVLTNALLPVLREGSDPRIINLSSAAQSSVLHDSFNSDIGLSDNEAYSRSKLAILLWSFDMANQYSKICTIALNPGSLLNTKMVKEAYGKFWSSADKGADIIVQLATNPEYSNFSGKYFDNDRGSFSDAHPDAYNLEIIEKLMDATGKVLA